MADNSVIGNIRTVTGSEFGSNFQEVTPESHPELSSSVDKIVDGMNEAFPDNPIEKPVVLVSDNKTNHAWRLNDRDISDKQVLVLSEGIVKDGITPNVEHTVAHELGHSHHNARDINVPEPHIDKDASAIQKLASNVRHEVRGSAGHSQQREYDADYRAAKTIGVDKVIEGLEKSDADLASPLRKLEAAVAGTHPKTSERIEAMETLRDKGDHAHEEFVQKKTHLKYDHQSLRHNE